MQDGGPPLKSKGRSLAGPVPGEGSGMLTGVGLVRGPEPGLFLPQVCFPVLSPAVEEGV